MNYEKKQEHILELNRYIQDLPNLHLARLLKDCFYGSLSKELNDYRAGYRVGHFSFSVNPHSTGIDYKVSVLAEDGECLVVEHMNFSFMGRDTIHERNYGVWDEALPSAVEHLIEKQRQYTLDKIKEIREDCANYEAEQQRIKTKFEALFNGAK